MSMNVHSTAEQGPVDEPRACASIPLMLDVGITIAMRLRVSVARLVARVSCV